MASRRTTAAHLGAIALVALGVAACDTDPTRVRGSGDVASEQREVSGFRTVALEGSGDLFVEVGDRESLTIEADDNLLDLISTDVRGSRLVIEFDEPLDPTRAIVYRLEAIEFEGVAVAGSADVTALDLDCDTFAVSVAGSGSFDLGGTCGELTVDIAGSGDVDASTLPVDRAVVSIAGSGDVSLDVRADLEVSIAGSGDVVYAGDPTTDIDVAGSGSVRREP